MCYNLNGDNMEITQKFIEESQIKNEGTTCYIMEHKSGVAFKIYKVLFDYIFKNENYELDEREITERLNYIVSKKEDVKLTKLPQEILTFNGKIVGVAIEYLEGSITLGDFLKETPEIDLAKVKDKVLEIVEELIANGIIPTDPHFDNFLISFCEDGTYKLNMVDIDDGYVYVYPGGKKDIWYESAVNTCYRVIDLSFKKIGEEKTKNCKS